MDSNYRWVWVLSKWLLLLGVPIGLLVLFTMQNLDRTTGLSLNLGFYAFELDHAWPVPCLMSVTFLLGWVVGELGSRIRSFRSERRGERISRDAALGSVDDDWR